MLELALEERLEPLEPGAAFADAPPGVLASFVFFAEEASVPERLRERVAACFFCGFFLVCVPLRSGASEERLLVFVRELLVRFESGVRLDDVCFEDACSSVGVREASGLVPRVLLVFRVRVSGRAD